MLLSTSHTNTRKKKKFSSKLLQHFETVQELVAVSHSNLAAWLWDEMRPCSCLPCRPVQHICTIHRRSAEHFPPSAVRCHPCMHFLAIVYPVSAISIDVCPVYLSLLNFILNKEQALFGNSKNSFYCFFLNLWAIQRYHWKSNLSYCIPV